MTAQGWNDEMLDNLAAQVANVTVEVANLTVQVANLTEATARAENRGCRQRPRHPSTS